MNNGLPDSLGSDDDSRDKWITIDRLCDAFEASLQDGDVERAAFLAGVPRNWRDQLSQELDAIEAAYRDARETREQTIKVPSSEKESRRLPSAGRLAELAALERDTVWLGRFEIRRRLGTGATGSVWCARDARLARWVALKVPHASRVMDESSAARFQTEARAAAAITHPNVVQVHEVLIEDGLPILIQQWIDGPSLSQKLKDAGPLDCEQAAEWLAQMADAVACAHSKGIVHRDLKPANVMLNNDRPMVLDFGLASYPPYSTGLTSEGTVLGTPAYMSPEQAEGNELANQPATDIYALGTILYEMLVGTPPFVGKAREVLHANKTAIPVSPRTRRSSIPRDLETITLRCLAKSPSARYRSAADLRDDLRRYLRREPIQARKVGMVETAISWCRLRPVYALLIAGIPLILFLAIGILVSQLQHYQLVATTTRLARQNHQGENERVKLLAQRNMVQLSRASHELAEGNRARGLRLLRSIPEPVRGWEWRLLDMMSHSPAYNIAKGVFADLPVSIQSFAVSSERRRLYAATSQGRIVYWDLPAESKAITPGKVDRTPIGKAQTLFEGQVSIGAMAVSPDQHYLAWVDRTGAVTLWNLVKNEQVQRLPIRSVSRGRAITFSPDSKRLLVGGGTSADVEASDAIISWLYEFRLTESETLVPGGTKVWRDRSAITSICFFSEDQFATTRGPVSESGVVEGSGIATMGFVEAYQYGGGGRFSLQAMLWRGLGTFGLDFDPTTNRLAWCDAGGMAYIKNLREPLKAPPRQFRSCRGAATCLQFSPDGQELVVGNIDGGISRWSTPFVEVTKDPNTQSSYNTSQSVQGRDSTAEPGDTENDETPESLPVDRLPIRHIRDYHGHENHIRAVVYLNRCTTMKGKLTKHVPNLQLCQPLVITGDDDGRVLQWANRGPRSIMSLTVSERPLNDARWISSKQIAVSTVAAKRQRLFYKMLSPAEHDIAVEMRRVRTPRMIANQTGGGAVGSTRESGHPQRYAVCSRNAVHVFNFGDNRVQRTLAVQKTLAVGGETKGAFSAATMIDSRYVIAAVVRWGVNDVDKNNEGNSNTKKRIVGLSLYDLDSEEEPLTIDLPPVGVVMKLRSTPTGNGVVGCTSSGKMFLARFNPSDGRQLTWASDPLVKWEAHRRSVRDFVWIDTDGRLASVGDDGNGGIWDLSSITANETAKNDLAAQDVKRGSEEDSSQQLESATPLLTQRLLVSSGPVTKVATNSSGERIVTAGADQIVRVWDTASGLELISFPPRKKRVVSIEFSPDNQYLLIAEADSRVEVIQLYEEAPENHSTSVSALGSTFKLER